MIVVIRADASQTIGIGHVMRCLTLAERLRLEGAAVSFICRDFPGNLSEYVRGKGFEVHLLSRAEAGEPEISGSEKVWLGTSWIDDARETARILRGYPTSVDWLIVDHYGIDHRWEAHLRHWTRKIMVIDDLANREHDCDLLLDQNYYHNLKNRYEDLVPKGCMRFLGPQYLLLREEFYQARKEMRLRTGEVSNILVFYGGADATNETEKCLLALSDFVSSDLEINVVTGRSNPNRERIEDLCSALPNVHYHCQVTNMAELMNKANLAFGAGGATTWERCFLGLPSIVTVTAENQRETTEAVADLGAIWNLGWYEKVTPNTLINAAKRVFTAPDKLVNMHGKAFALFGTRSVQGIEQMVGIMVHAEMDLQSEIVVPFD